TRWPRDWSSDVCSSDLTVPIETRGIIVHFADPEFAIRTKIDGHGINHQWLACSQFYLQIGFGAKTRESFSRIFRRRKLGLFRIRSEEHTSELQSRGHLV